ncbi:MAG: uncharacterized protein JWO51_142 [Rhodospirillales bacterium]|nr:uncharacterized protein [Rhodospirillales bacterium]
MSNAIFPTLPSLSWSTFKRPTFSTRISKRTSGREVRAANYAYPLYEFELTYEALRASQVYVELQTLMGFFLQRQGSFDSFLFTDPTDNTVASQVIATGDGVTTSFTLVRAVGGWVEPIGQAANQPSVYVNGALQATNTWGITLPNTLTFSAAPGAGQQILVTNLQYYFVCRFSDDVHDYENFMDQLWTLKSCKFVSVKP